MNPYWQSRDFKLTGRVRYRRADERLGLWKREPVMVAQVEEEYVRGNVLEDAAKAQTYRHWRDMRTTDLKFLTSTASDTPIAAEHSPLSNGQGDSARG